MAFGLEKLVGKVKKAWQGSTQPVVDAVEKGAKTLEGSIQPVIDVVERGAEDLGAKARAAKEAAVKAVPGGKAPKPSTDISKKPSQG